MRLNSGVLVSVTQPNDGELLLPGIPGQVVIYEDPKIFYIFHFLNYLTVKVVEAVLRACNL